ncbi:TonB-dependent receptor [Sphingomonas sp. 1P06PA]|uniref:TonB-dependent receptor n=1 Tax=Sphingomonas sp. 1P06PA TaxID=554121 RepID=UPI0039A732C4
MGGFGRTIFGGLLLASSATAAIAQSTPGPSSGVDPSATPTGVAQVEQAPAAAVREGGLEEIVVTARKRVESAQNVPVAVTAFTPQQIQQSDLTSLEKVSAVTPSFTIARSTTGSGAQISLRGIGSDARSIGLEQSVAVIVDGVYYGQGRVINEGFFDLAGLEILKGPQALFYGKNATAGVVSLTTANPGSRPEYLARAGYEFNAQRIYGEAIASSPLTETLGLRVAFRASKMYGGYVESRAPDITYTTRDVATGIVTTRVAPRTTNDLPGEREYLGRVTLAWEPTDRLSVTVKGSITRNDTKGPGWNNLIFYCPRGGNSALNQSIPCRKTFVTYQNDLPDDVGASLPYSDDGALFMNYKSDNLTGTVNYDLGAITITSVSNYNRSRLKFLLDGDYQAGQTQTTATERSTFRAISNETRILSDFDGPVNFLLGGYYQDTHRWFNQLVPTGNVENSAAPEGNRFVGFSKLSTTDGETLSAYGQLIWKVVPQVEVTGGVRYIHETKDSAFVQPYVHPNLAALYPAGRVVTADQTFENWSPEATITYRPTDNLTVYAAYKTAYKSGGFSNSTTLTNGARDSDLAFAPEKARGFEGGIKGTVLDRQLRFDLTVYNYKFTNLQVEFFNAATFAQISTNAGSARTTGVELQAEFAPRGLDGLTMRGSINYNKARYLTFIAPCYAGQTPTAGCNTIFLGGVGQDLSGVETSVAPRWTGALGASYLAPVSGGMSFGASIDARYSDDYLGSPLGNPFTRQPSYVTLDATARLLFDDERFELALIGKNLTNKYIFTGAVDAPSTGSGTGTAAGVVADQRGYVSPPRTVQAQLTYRF